MFSKRLISFVLLMFTVIANAQNARDVEQLPADGEVGQPDGKEEPSSLQNQETDYPELYNSGHFVYASAGIGFTLEEAQSGWISGNPEAGVQWTAGYEWVSDEYCGVGFLYNGFTSGGRIAMADNRSKRARYFVHYIAPQAVVRFPLHNDRWCLKGAVGAGFAIYNKTDDTGVIPPSEIASGGSSFGFGVNYKFGIEYRLTDRLWLTFELNSVNYIINHQNGKYGLRAKRGTERGGLNLGFCFRL